MDRKDLRSWASASRERIFRSRSSERIEDESIYVDSGGNEEEEKEDGGGDGERAAEEERVVRGRGHGWRRRS